MDDNKENAENISPNGIEDQKNGMEEKINISSNVKTTTGFDDPEPLTTKVYYFVDNQPMPYCTEVPVPPSRITLADFKSYTTRRNYKYYCVMLDSTLKAEVKAEIRDDYECLKPSSNGRFELFLLSESVPEGFVSHHRHALVDDRFQVQKNCAVRSSMMGSKRPSSYYIMMEQKSSAKFIEEADSSPEDSCLNTNNRLFADSNFTGSFSDGDSQYTTDFTSVSQQRNPARYGFSQHNAPPPAHPTRQQQQQVQYDYRSKPYTARTREKRKRFRRQRSPPSSFLSSTFDDTEVSMALDLITVTFNMDTRRPFGMSVVVKRNRFFYGIIVHEVSPNSLVALDGRIKPGFILLEINGIALDEYETPEAAVHVLSSAVRQAVESRGQLKLTCARGDVQAPAHNIFRPPPEEPVRPIDPTAWVQHTNAARGIECFASHHDITPKAATMPSKTNFNMDAGVKTCGKGAADLEQHNFVPQKCSGGGLKLTQNPSTEITEEESSANSSLECSIGQQRVLQQNQKQQQFSSNAVTAAGGADEGNKKKQVKSGGIGAVLRRLVCFHTSSPKRKNSWRGGRSESVKRRNSDKGGGGSSKK